MGVDLQTPVMDLNRATVEYVCTRFQSPHLSRRYGHKLYTEEDPYLEAMRALSEDRLTEPEMEERPVRRQALSLYLEPSRGQSWPQLVSSSSRASELRELRDLTRNTRS